MKPVGELRVLGRALAEAEGSQIARAVALLDALPARGAADALIAPLRGRMRALGIRRRLNWRRLLFRPLDPVIHPAGGWTPGSATLPRTALMPLAEAVRTGAAEEVAAVEAALRSAPDPDAAWHLGPLLWPAAVAPLRALADAPSAEACAASGLAAGVLGPIARGAAAVLEAADLLRAAGIPGAGEAAAEAALAEALDGAAAEGVAAWSLVTAVALVQTPDPALVVRVAAGRAGSGAPGYYQGMQQALDAATARLERDAVAPAPAAAAAALQAARLIEGASKRTSPTCRGMLADFRARVAETCRTRFAAELASRLLQPMGALPPDPDPAVIGALEQAARDLRGLEQAARQLGGGTPYGPMLHAALAALAKAPEGTLDPIDRVRLTEILAGPDAALALLAA